MATLRFVLELYRSSKWATVFFYFFNFENYSRDIIYTQHSRWIMMPTNAECGLIAGTYMRINY
jgi:hypothetical protein